MTLETRETILEAALRCFSRTGYHKTSMDDIVSESQVSKGGLYWHFKSKQELFMALFEYMFERAFQHMHIGEPKEPLPPKQELEGLLLSAGAALDAIPQGLISTASFLMELWKLPGFWEAYKNMLSPFAGMVSAVIQRGIEAGVFRQVEVEDTVWSIMAALDGVMLYAALGEKETFHALYRTTVDLLVGGLCLPEDLKTTNGETR